MWSRLTAAFSRTIKSKAGEWVTALFVALGIGLATHSLVVDPLLDELRSIAQGSGNDAGNVALQWLGFLNFDKAFTMILSAIAAKESIRAAKVYLARR